MYSISHYRKKLNGKYSIKYFVPKLEVSYFLHNFECMYFKISSYTKAKIEPVKETRKPSVSEASTLMVDLLKDTTEEHSHHLFDSNCKICTGKLPPPGESQVTGVSTAM